MSSNIPPCVTLVYEENNQQCANIEVQGKVWAREHNVLFAKGKFSDMTPLVKRFDIESVPALILSKDGAVTAYKGNSCLQDLENDWEE